MARKIAIAARKGGVGKTTVACGLASVFASQGKRVLLLDLDPQSNAAFVLGADPTAPGVAELLLGKTPEPLEAAANLYVLPGGPNLTGHGIQALDPQELADAIAGLDYEMLLFDCPPGVEYLERFALVAADIALICTDAHPLALIGAGRVITDLELRSQKGRQGAKRWGLVMTRIDTRRSLDQSLENELAEAYPAIDRLQVRQDSALAWASAGRIPIMTYGPASKGASDLKELAEWVAKNG